MVVVKFVSEELAQRDKIIRAKKLSYSRDYYATYCRQTERDMAAFRGRQRYRKHYAETGVMDRTLLRIFDD